jgi:hypothetical protein
MPYSSVSPYTFFRWTLRSMIKAITTDVRSRGSFSSVGAVGTAFTGCEQKIIIQEESQEEYYLAWLGRPLS